MSSVTLKVPGQYNEVVYSANGRYAVVNGTISADYADLTELLALGFTFDDPLLQALYAGFPTQSLDNLKIFPDRRLPWLVGDLGDSRAASLYTGARQRGGDNPLNLACALSHQRYRIAGGFGMSGKRTDEYLVGSNLAAVVASRCGIIRIIGAVNDIGANYPTATTSGATAAANVQAAILNTLRPAGIRTIVEAEPGFNGATTTQLAQIYDYNYRMREFCERTPGCYWHDARSIMLIDNSSTTVLAFKANYNYDDRHPSGLGAYYWAKSLNQLITSLTPFYPPWTSNITEVPANGRRQLTPNPFFFVTSGGSSSTGATASNGQANGFPANCTVNRGPGTPTVVCTPAFKDTQLAITFGAQSDNARIAQTVQTADWAFGDSIYAMAKFTANSPKGLAGIQLSMVPNVDGVPVTITDGATTANRAGPDETYSMTLLTDLYTVPNGTTKTSLAATLAAIANGAGAAWNLNVEYMEIIRRTTV